MTDTNYALRELLIACADWYGSGKEDNPAAPPEQGAV